MQTIIILDAAGAEVTRFETSNPQWAFDEYCRNRETVDWSWVTA